MWVAFLYDNYYCWSPKKNYRGTFGSEDDAQKSLRGGRWENQNLELYNIHTEQWRTYEWKSDYEIDRDYNLSIEHIAASKSVQRDTITSPRDGDYVQEKKHRIANESGRWSETTYFGE